ncbi:GGDEF domain-containing protein [Pandoraea bronchicola]|uniref:diguanylate cyclase n=1 Tax=Pandoraea bronchicola TaxID=2508287 RepID=A0A5E5BP36_9BURK|nr:GGDEF domain-containing protein [Pandoraea bronchicola]VVE87066.1 GGDEF domain-containing protein [Pandoraea bronchicola]
MKHKLLSALSLNGRLRLQNLAVVSVVVILCSSLLIWAWESYQRANDASVALDALRATLLAMEKASAERGPANAVLGADLPLPNESVIALRNAREATNARLQELLSALSDDACDPCGSSLRAVERARLDLAAASANVDLLVQRPREMRSDAAVRDAVDRMVRVIADFAPVASSRIDVISRGVPDALHYIILARLAADLREYAGQLGSNFTATLTTGKTLSDADQRTIERTLGRIDQLREMIGSRMNAPPELGPEMLNALNRQYFAAGLNYVATVRTLASQPRPTSLTTAEFAHNYVPTMRAITDFRDDMFSLARHQVDAKRSSALKVVIFIALTEVALVLLIVFVLRNFRRSVVQPLEAATRFVDALAQGNLEAPLPDEGTPMRRGQVRALFEALRVLKQNAIELVQLRRERTRLASELEMSTDTDPLTRLMNWRAFERQARALCAMPSPGRVALIKFDIDNFSQINATWGHAVGDDVLRRVGTVCLNTSQPGDVVARLGADAFVILARVLDGSRAQQFAELLRGRIEATALTLPHGKVLPLTASFGIAVDNAVTFDANGLTAGEPANISALLSQAERQLHASRQARRHVME